MKLHRYDIEVNWTGNDGAGTESYKSYRRDHTIVSPFKPEIPGSSDPAFRGNRGRYSPEELLVSSLSACYMLWYLHLCATHKIVVSGYSDSACGEMRENADGSGEFVRVLLKPSVRIAKGDPAKALALHDEAHLLCFIARSVNFPVQIEAAIVAESDA